MADTTDINRHAGIEPPSGPVPKPELGDLFGPGLDASARREIEHALPVKGSQLIEVRHYGRSLWGQTAKLTAQIPDGSVKYYFFKTASTSLMIDAELSGLSQIYHVSPSFVPEPLGSGSYFSRHEITGEILPRTHFLITSFRKIGLQPPTPAAFVFKLADLHKTSVSPTGKFGSQKAPCHATISYHNVITWQSSWSTLFRDILAHTIILSQRQHKGHDSYADFQRIGNWVLDKVISRLLNPLEGKIKPCLIHGDLWDENTATDAVTGEPFVFDPMAFYAHNEYEIGNWRAARHRLSRKEYVDAYKELCPPDEPGEPRRPANVGYVSQLITEHVSRGVG
ncbi:Fructosamine kinase-domain-containing protein [Apiosordaria backusii]|uniref:protein-ribulosamine 3-kinase n=1 Tax=Apiosordaria backusii TaxID=314023 RepID=A0AA40AJ24_9PEZI|nr:Fructosamine kinase-domain-containing protein [Apiosordaria backusii]